MSGASRKQTSGIERLAREILDEREWRLAAHLAFLLNDSQWDAKSLILDILPKYWEGHQTLEPDPIYRPLYYLDDAPTNFRRVTRWYIDLTAAHLEGCLLWLTENPPRFRSPSKPFGGLVTLLQDEKILSSKLASELFKFNEIVNVPAKHFGVNCVQGSRLDKRTFSVLDASLSFVMMRKFSIQLFDLLASRGVTLPGRWKDFKDEWLLWDRKAH